MNTILNLNELKGVGSGGKVYHFPANSNLTIDTLRYNNFGGLDILTTYVPREFFTLWSTYYKPKYMKNDMDVITDYFTDDDIANRLSKLDITVVIHNDNVDKDSITVQEMYTNVGVVCHRVYSPSSKVWTPWKVVATNVSLVVYKYIKNNANDTIIGDPTSLVKLIENSVGVESAVRYIGDN